MGEVRDPGFSILPHNNSSFKDGVEYERNRIIKLLEANKIPCDCGEACEQWDAGFEEAIAIVKGESK